MRHKQAPDSLPRRIRTVLAGHSGVALLMVLFVVVALTSLVVALTESTQRHIHLTQYQNNRLQAFWTAQSGVQLAVALLKMRDTTQMPGLPQMTGQPLQMGGQGYDAYNSIWNAESPLYQEFVQLFLSVPLCENSFFEPAILPAIRERPDQKTEEVRTPFPIVDENSKLSLYDLVNDHGTIQEATNAVVFERLVYLLTYLVSEEDLLDPGDLQDPSASWGRTEPSRWTPIDPGRAEVLAGYVVDWIDTPANTSTGVLNRDTAETSCPEDGLPYQAKNGKMDSVDEIALVCGFRRLPRRVIEELGRNLTVFDLGARRININTATRPVLYALCAQLDDSGGALECAEAIHHRLHPYEDDLPDVVIETHSLDGERGYLAVLQPLGISNALIEDLLQATGVRSEYFRIGVNGVVINPGTGSVDALAGVTMVVGPPRAGMTRGMGLYYYRED